MKTNLLFRVRYAETDQMGIVHHSNYLEWFEMGRVQLLDELGMSYQGIEKSGIRLAVTEVSIKYRQSAYFDDNLVVVCELLQVRSRSVSFKYQIKRVIDDQLLAEGITYHMPIDQNGKGISLSAELREILK